MNKLMPYLVKVFFALFIVAVFVGIISMSFKGLGYIFPDDLFDQAIGLVLFDLAALVWFAVLIYICASTMQYVFSALGFLTGFLGTIGLVGIEVGISSGMLLASEMTKPLTYVFIAVFVGHLALIYLFHASAPETDAKISLGIDKAKIVDEGRKQAEAHLANTLPQLGAAISARLVAEVMRDLNLQPQVIDGKLLPLDVLSDDRQAANVQAQGKPAPAVWEWLKAFGSKARKYEHAVAEVAEVEKKPAPVMTETKVKERLQTQAFYIECAIDYDLNGNQIKKGDQLIAMPISGHVFEIFMPGSMRSIGYLTDADVAVIEGATPAVAKPEPADAPYTEVEFRDFAWREVEAPAPEFRENGTTNPA